MIQASRLDVRKCVYLSVSVCMCVCLDVLIIEKYIQNLDS